MSFDLDSVAARLASSDVENAGDLSPADAERARGAVAKCAADGLRARVVALPRGAAIEPWHALFSRARLDEHDDLLLLWNGQRMEARGWGLDPRGIHAAIASVDKLIETHPGQAIAGALDRLLIAAGGGGRGSSRARPVAGQEESAPPSSSPPAGASSLLVFGGGGVIALGALTTLGLIIRRRNQRAAETRKEFADAMGAADQRYSELMLSAEELQGGEAEALQLRAGTLKQRLEALSVEARDAAAGDPVLVGKVRQLENEIVALRSTVLQKQRR